MKERPLELILLEVTREDIDEMYDRYDSGMADRTTSNAVSLALGRKLKSLCLPKIVSAARHHGCRLHIGRDTYPLPQAGHRRHSLVQASPANLRQYEGPVAAVAAVWCGPCLESLGA